MNQRMTEEEWEQWTLERVQREKRWQPPLSLKALRKARMHRFIKINSTDKYWLNWWLPDPEAQEPWDITDFGFKDVPLAPTENDDPGPARYLRIYGENRTPCLGEYELTFGSRVPSWAVMFFKPEGIGTLNDTLYQDRYGCDPPRQFSRYVGDSGCKYHSPRPPPPEPPSKKMVKQRLQRAKIEEHSCRIKPKDPKGKEEEPPPLERLPPAMPKGDAHTETSTMTFEAGSLVPAHWYSAPNLKPLVFATHVRVDLLLVGRGPNRWRRISPLRGSCQGVVFCPGMIDVNGSKDVNANPPWDLRTEPIYDEWNPLRE